MTLICAVKSEGHVIMAADGVSCANDNTDVFRVKTPKLAVKKVPIKQRVSDAEPDARERLLIAHTGLHTMGSVIEHDWSPPAFIVTRHKTTFKWARECAETLWDKFHEDRWWPIVKFGQNEALWDARMLMGFRGDIFHVGTDGCVDEFLVDYWAIGSAEDTAWGALHATANLDLEPAARLNLAMKAAEYHHPVIQGPYQIATTEEK